MLCKYYIQLGSTTLDTDSPDCMDVSGMIKDLDSIKVTYARVDFGGVVRKCGSSLEFTGKAYDAILAHYMENYLQSKGVFAVYVADNNWEYSKAWECPLDFATLQYDAHVVTIGCVDNSAAAIIKANKNSKYEFEVSGIKETSDLLYNGVATQRKLIFNVVGTTGDGAVGSDQYSYTTILIDGHTDRYTLYVPRIGVDTSSYNSEAVSIRDQEECYARNMNDNYNCDDGLLTEQACWAGGGADYTKNVGFIRALKACAVHVSMHLNMIFRPELIIDGVGSMSSLLSHVAFNFILVAGHNVVWRKRASVGDNIIDIDMDCTLGKDDYLAFVVSIQCLDPDYTYNLFGHDYFNIYYFNGIKWGSNQNTAYVNESHYIENPIAINAVKPITLLKKLVDKMFEGRGVHVQCEIDMSDNILRRTLLVAAESVRRITTNKLYTSFSDFCKFMEVVFGYVYTLEDIGYYMDEELVEIDQGIRTTLSHINVSRLTSPYMLGRTAGFYRMLIISGIISRNLGNGLDLTTEYTIRNGVYVANVYYIEYANTFAVYDEVTGKYYANYHGASLFQQGSWFNDEKGHAREMIGLRLGVEDTNNGMWKFGIVRNGRLVWCDAVHNSAWLDSNENNWKITELTFKHRNSIFKQERLKTLGNVNNISYQINDGIVYSSVEVGYRKKDYDNDNSAINEFNFTNYYKTDTDITDATLSLICPYRADCYGIEELLLKSKENDRDNESTDSDSSIFIVIASSNCPEGGYWQIDRSEEVINAYTDTVFNAAIAPNRIVLNNEGYIGASIRKMKFTSSDGNSSAVIGGIPMSGDISITKQLFKAGKISIETDDHNFPESWDGLIEFEYADKTYRGFLDSIDICFANLGTIKYNLIEQCIE